MLKNLPLLLLSVMLSSTRNITSKKTAADSNEKVQFYFSQTILFGVAAVLIILLRLRSFEIAFQTVIYGIIYGFLLILSQWMLTIALGLGNTSVCSVVYSMGFLIPTVSGTLFWNEPFTVLQGIGLIAALSAITLTVRKDNSNLGGKKFVLAIVSATAASGGLGIMQKVQQASPTANQEAAFLTVAFMVAFTFSFFAFLLCRPCLKPQFKSAIIPAVTGICFGGANVCNTLLAGRLPSAVFFPTQNILTILLSSVAGIIIFKEKSTLKTILITILGIIAVILFTL